MIIVRGDSEKIYHTVIIKTKIEEIFYAFPKDTTANYRFLGYNSDGFHDSDMFGEITDTENLPAQWLEIANELNREAEERARSEGATNE